MSERTVSLAEICAQGGGGIQTGPFGSQLHAHEYVDDGVPVVMPQDLIGGRISTVNIARVTDARAKDLMRHRLKLGDIVYSRRGDVTRKALVREANVGWLCGTGCLKIDLGPRPAIDHKYLAYFLDLSAIREWVVQQAVGATMLNLNTGILGRVLVRLPSRGRQLAIGELLCALDDKIAANSNEISRFDSLIALHYENQATNAPLSPLSGLASFINGRAFTKDATGVGRVVIRIAELNSGLGASTVRTDLEAPDQHLARPGDLLFAWSGSLTVHRWFRDEAIINQHIFKVIPNGYPVWLVRAALDWALAEFKSIAADKTTTMGHIQRHHLDLPVPVPAPHVIQSLDPLLSALWERALAAERESLKLAELRDTLLGPLMSGRLKIKDAERVVEEVV